MSETVSIPASTLHAMQSQLAELQGRQSLADAAREVAEAKAMIEQGRADAFIGKANERVKMAEDSAKQSAIDAELARAIGAYKTVQGAPEQLRAILRDQLTADRAADGRYAVRTATFQSVDEFVSKTLATEPYSHFVEGQSAPATGPLAAPGTPQPHENPLVSNPLLRAMGDVFTRNSVSAAHHNASTTDPTMDMSRPFGLRARR